MELIPKQLVVGVISPSILPGTPGQVTADKINRAWAELATRYRYSQLQLSPDGSAGNFLAATPDDGVMIQPPVIQFRSSIHVGGDQGGDSAHDAIGTIARHLGATDFQQLGVKLVYWAALPDNDGPGFVLHKVFGKSEADFAAVQEGAQQLVAGAKFVVSRDTSVYTVLVEPLLRDPKMLFLDIDAQFPGPADLDKISDRAREVENFAARTLKGFLETL